MPKTERPKSGKRRNPNDRSFEQIIVQISVVRDRSFLFEQKSAILDRVIYKNIIFMYI